MTGPILRTDLVTVFRLRAFVRNEIAERVRADLRGVQGVRHVMVDIDPGHETARSSGRTSPRRPPTGSSRTSARSGSRPRT